MLNRSSCHFCFLILHLTGLCSALILSFSHVGSQAFSIPEVNIHTQPQHTSLQVHWGSDIFLPNGTIQFCIGPPSPRVPSSHRKGFAFHDSFFSFFLCLASSPSIVWCPCHNLLKKRASGHSEQTTRPGKSQKTGHCVVFLCYKSCLPISHMH